MKIIACIADNCGLMFNHRRLSRDRYLINDMETLLRGEGLHVSPYSETLFCNSGIKTFTVGDFPRAVGQGQWAFIEDVSLGEVKSQIETAVIYRWNRDYPADFFLDFSPTELGMILSEVKDLAGSSHERITREIYLSK